MWSYNSISSWLCLSNYKPKKRAYMTHHYCNWWQDWQNTCSVFNQLHTGSLTSSRVPIDSLRCLRSMVCFLFFTAEKLLSISLVKVSSKVTHSGIRFEPRRASSCQVKRKIPPATILWWAMLCTTPALASLKLLEYHHRPLSNTNKTVKRLIRNLNLQKGANRKRWIYETQRKRKRTKWNYLNRW